MPVDHQDDLPRMHRYRRTSLRLDVIAQGGQPVRRDLLEHQLAEGFLQRTLVGRSTHRERAVGELLALALRITLELEVAFDRIQAALAAGMRCVAVAHTFPSEQLRAAHLIRSTIAAVTLPDLAGRDSC